MFESVDYFSMHLFSVFHFFFFLAAFDKQINIDGVCRDRNKWTDIWFSSFYAFKILVPTIVKCNYGKFYVVVVENQINLQINVSFLLIAGQIFHQKLIKKKDNKPDFFFFTFLSGFIRKRCRLQHLS